MKSGIEMIEDLVKKVDLMNRRLTVIEQSTKEILNRANGFENKKVSISAAPVAKKEVVNITPATETKKAVNITPATEKVQIGKNLPKLKQEKPKTVKVLGKIKNAEGKSVSGVRVRVYNPQNQVVKQTKTNRAGEWVSFLPQGKYAAEYFLKDMINENVNFEVTSKQKMLRVAQPES